MASLEERVAALESKVEQLHLFDQMTTHIVEVVQLQGREAMRAIADLGEQVDRLEGKVDTLEIKVDANTAAIVQLDEKFTAAIVQLDEKFDAHTNLLHKILARLPE